MRKLPSTLKWQHIALVEGHGLSGLFNCMRYDRATFYEEVDANVAASVAFNPLTTFRIVLTRYSETKKASWTVDKWKSHHLTVTPIIDGSEYHIKRGLQPFNSKER